MQNVISNFQNEVMKRFPDFEFNLLVLQMNKQQVLKEMVFHSSVTM